VQVSVNRVINSEANKSVEFSDHLNNSWLAAKEYAPAIS